MGNVNGLELVGGRGKWRAYIAVPVRAPPANFSLTSKQFYAHQSDPIIRACSTHQNSALATLSSIILVYWDVTQGHFASEDNLGTQRRSKAAETAQTTSSLVRSLWNMPQ